MNPLKTKYEYLLFFINAFSFLLMIVKSDAAFCGEPPEVLNAERNRQDEQLPPFPNGTLVSYKCNDGYVLKNGNNAIAICIADNDTALWEHDEFSCEQTCGDPPTIPHTQLNLEGKSPPYVVGETIGLNCDMGYISGGVRLRIKCELNEQGNAEWTVPDRGCSARSCNYPSDIENAYKTGDVYTFPNSVTFTCNEGYKMRGSSTIYCSASGSWTPSRLPVCEAIICPLLPNPTNGRVISVDRKYGSIATYECNRGFALEGDKQRVCRNDSAWSGHLPLCSEITCPNPGEIENGRVLPDRKDYKLGDNVIFSCKVGGESFTSQCLENREWSKRPPICPDIQPSPSPPQTADPGSVMPPNVTKSPTEVPEDKDNACDDPGTIPHGKRKITSLIPNGSVSYSCQDGYELRGTGTLVCLSTGKWNLDKLPICVKPIPVTTIVGIVIGIICIIGVAIAGYFCYQWREHKLRGYGQKSKALTTDATDMDEVARLEKEKKPIPVTVL